MMVVAVVAILFVGPKELPAMLRTFGRSIKKLRSMAGDFQKQFDDALFILVVHACLNRPFGLAQNNPLRLLGRQSFLRPQ